MVCFLVFIKVVIVCKIVKGIELYLVNILDFILKGCRGGYKF